MTDATKPIRRRTISVGLLILTFFAIAVETTFFLPAISNSWRTLLFLNQAGLFFPNDWLSLLGFIIFPIVYCSFASIVLHPKTMVNPILVQIGTIALVIILAMVNISNTQFILPTQFIAVLSFAILLSAIFVIFVGIVQWLIVLWVIRMNYEDSDRVSYVINMKPKEILHKLGNSFLDDWGFSREHDVGEIWVLERNDNERCLLLELGTHPRDESKSILATVSYEKIGATWLVKSDSAKHLAEVIIDDIERHLDIKFKENTTDLTDSISKLAYANIENLSRSRIEVTWVFLRKLSRPFKVMLGLTLFLLLGISVLYFNFNQQKYISSDTYIATVIGLVIVLLFEIGLPLRDELQKRKREEIEI